MGPEFSPNRTDYAVKDGRCNQSDSDVSLISSYFLCAFVGSLSLLIISGNSLVIVSIVYFKQLHAPTNYLILSLAVADLLVGVVVLPFSTFLSVSSCWYLASLLCKVRGAFDVFLCASSILNLCCISVDRYYMVCQPLVYRIKMTVHFTGILILGIWGVSALLGIGVAMSWLRQPQSQTKCSLFQKTKSVFEASFFAFYLPALIILIIYMKILFVAHRQVRTIQNTAKCGATVSKVERKATKTLAVVIGVFLMCWTPFFLSMSCHSMTDFAVPAPVIETFKWFGWSNSMLNPLVYGFFYSWFRKAFRIIISGKIFQVNCSNSKLF